jgi:hypothetical protein
MVWCPPPPVTTAVAGTTAPIASPTVSPTLTAVTTSASLANYEVGVDHLRQSVSSQADTQAVSFESAFLGEFHRLNSQGLTDRCLDLIIRWFDSELKQGAPGIMRCDAVLRAIDDTILDEDLIVGFLSATYPGRKLIPYRATFLERARAHLSRMIGAEEANALAAELV